MKVAVFKPNMTSAAYATPGQETSVLYRGGMSPKLWAGAAAAAVAAYFVFFRKKRA